MCKVGVCEGGEEEITLECPSLAALIFRGPNFVSNRNPSEETHRRETDITT